MTEKTGKDHQWSKADNDLLISTQASIYEALNRLGDFAEMSRLLREPIRMMMVKIPF
nr:hypothetical protein [uncultured Bacillus sp.]